MVKGSGESHEDQRNIILELREECIDAVKRVVEKAEKEAYKITLDMLEAHKKLSFLASNFASYFGTAEIPRNIKLVLSLPGFSVDEDIKTYMDKLNAIKQGIKVLQDIKKEKMMKIQRDIQNLCEEITESSILCNEFTEVEPTDLSTKRFQEYQSLLDELEHDKSCRAQKVSELLTTVADLCDVLGMDFCSTAAEVHQSLSGSTSVHSISTNTLNKLPKKVLILKEEKKRRLHMLQELVFQLNFHWNLMDTPPEERKLFDHVTCNISASADEVTLPEGGLAMDLIEKAEVVVKRLDQLYVSRIAFKREAAVNLKALQENAKAFVDIGDTEITQLFVDPTNLIAKQKEEKQRIEGPDEISVEANNMEPKTGHDRQEQQSTESEDGSRSIPEVRKRDITRNWIPWFCATCIIPASP